MSVDEKRVLTVGELSAHIRSLLESRYPFVRVAGEISNLSQPASGHLYFTLKDTQAQLRVVLFKMQRRYLARPLHNGMEVICLGRLSVYEPRGEYQLIADTVDFRGAGALQQSFEALKAQLAAEGLFNQENKRPLPFLPRHITLLTSPTGAALHDFLRVARRRFPAVRIGIYPVPVQGAQAAVAMVAGLDRIREQIQTDVLVLCRGGGAAEDLWAYNDAELVRAIRRGSVPVVSAVGHEIDFTLADFAADLRAPTPSAAAELLLPERLALHKVVAVQRARLVRLMEQALGLADQRLHFLRYRLQTLPHPVDSLQLRVARLVDGMAETLGRRMAGESQRLELLEQRLQLSHPRLAVDRQAQRLAALQKRLVQAGIRVLRENEGRFLQAAAVLRAVSPLATLLRGYAIVRKGDAGRSILRSATQVEPGERVEVLLAAGRLVCAVEAVLPEEEEAVTMPEGSGGD